jgi:hypothetical protein
MLTHPFRILAASILLLILWLPTPTRSQGTAPPLVGYYPYQTYDGAKEDINLASGNLTIRLPLIKLPGRNGHDLDFAWTYNSQIWYQQSYQVLVGNPPNQSYQTQYYWANNPSWSWGPPSNIAPADSPASSSTLIN